MDFVRATHRRHRHHFTRSELLRVVDVNVASSLLERAVMRTTSHALNCLVTTWTSLLQPFPFNVALHILKVVEGRNMHGVQKTGQGHESSPEHEEQGSCNINRPHMEYLPIKSRSSCCESTEPL